MSQGVAQIEVELDDQGTAEITTRVPMVTSYLENSGTKFVRYLRVSTQKQGIDGNGMAAQERDIDIFLKGQINPQVIETYCEVESGAVSARPQLQAALKKCRETGAHLVCQKIDRISRDVEFWASLVKDKRLTIRVANIPHADTFTIHLFAALAQQEREFISQRTKAAMAAAKARGVVFGNPRLDQINKERQYKTRKKTLEVAPIVLPLRKKGMTLQQIATTLNEMGMKTSTGGIYYPTQIKRIVERASA